LRIGDCGLGIADWGLGIVDCGLRIADCGFRIVGEKDLKQKIVTAFNNRIASTKSLCLY